MVEKKKKTNSKSSVKSQAKSKTKSKTFENRLKGRGLNQKHATFLLGFVMFFTGLCGIIYEYIMSALSTFILGNSIEQFSIIIGIMMFMMAVAAWVQAQISDDFLIEKFIFVELLLALIGGFGPIVSYYAYSYINDHFFLIMYSVIISIGFLIGLEIPFATRINEVYVKSLRKNMATIFSFDYFGSLIGAFLFALFLIKTFAITQTSLIIASINFFVAIISYYYFAKYVKLNHKFLMPIFVLMFVLLIVGFMYHESYNESLEQRLYKDKIIFAKTTPYQRLVLTHNEKINDTRLYINGNLQFSSYDEKRYHELLVHPAFSVAKSRERILILGGGDGLVAREVLKYDDVEKVVLVDIDPDMIKISQENEILSELNDYVFDDFRLSSNMIEWETLKNQSIDNLTKLEVLTLDAQKFVDVEVDKYDVIIVDLPDPNSIELVKLYSYEFYSKVYDMLEDDGVIAVQSTSPFFAPKTYLCIRETLQAAGFEVVSYHDNVPSFGDWGFNLAFKDRNMVLHQDVRSIEDFEVETKYLTPGIFRGALEFEKGFFDDEVEINTVLKPVMLTYYLDESWLYE